MFLRALPWLMLSLLALAGCAPECPNPDGTTSPINHKHHCYFCGHACNIWGVADAHQRCTVFDEDSEYLCGLEPGWTCAPGYFDLDDLDGCECFGLDAESCQPCGAEDLPNTGLDEDCDLRIDEVADDQQYRGRPNGPLGVVPDDELLYGHERLEGPPLSRAACGAAGVSCALPAGGGDVRCVPADGHSTCEPVPAEPVAQALGGARIAAIVQPLTGAEADCGDGLDDDGNGVIDDGPTCQTLVPSVSAPECHGRTGEEDCPPAYVPLDPEHVRLRGSEKPLVARMHYDVLIDKAEATRRQVRRFLEVTGRCDRPEDERHPLCGSTADPDLPAGGLDWCVAYDYCQWAGKRLPTELEWLRAFGGTTGGVEGEGCADGANTAECGATGPRPVGQSGGHATKGIDGESVITDAIGNVAEWVFDAKLAPCEAPWADCSRAAHFAVDIPDDPVLHAPVDDLRRPRIVRGGGWASEFGAASVEQRQFAAPGVEVAHYGVRCAQTFRPMRESLPDVKPIEQVPYDWTADPERYAKCEPLPATERLARRTLPLRLSSAAQACLPGDVPSEVSEAVVQGLIGATPLLLSVTDEGPGAATMAVETGLVPGAEAFWLVDRPPSLTLIAEGCTPFGCTFERSMPGAVTLPTWWGGTAKLALSGMRPIFGAMPTCLPPTPFGETAWRLDLVVPASLASAVILGDAKSTACAHLTCIDRDLPAARCAAECPGWHLPVHVQMHRLTVP